MSKRNKIAVGAWIAAALYFAARAVGVAFIAVVGVTASSGAATYALANANHQHLPYFTWNYNPSEIHFEKASQAMIAVVMADAGDYSFRAPDGTLLSHPLDLNGLPFWILAQYRAKSGCQYDLIDGATPALYAPLPEVGAIPVGDQPVNTAIERNCGRGFELVSQESYVSIFDDNFHSPTLKGHPGVRELGEDVPAGLIRDYVKRLVVAFGGKVTLQKRLDDAAKQFWKEYPGWPYRIMKPLRTALVAEDIRIPTE